MFRRLALAGLVLSLIALTSGCGEGSDHDARIAALEAEIQSLREGAPESLTVRELTVVDEDGRRRAILGAPGASARLVLLDTEGREQAVLTADLDSSSLRLTSGTDESGVVLNSVGSDFASASVFGEASSVRMSTLGGRPELRLDTPEACALLSGHPRPHLSLGEDGGSLLVLISLLGEHVSLTPREDC